MSEDNLPPERDVKDYKFQQLCKVQIRDPVETGEIKGHFSLIESSSKYGLTFIGVKNGFKVIRTQQFIVEDLKHVSERLQHVINDMPIVSVVDTNKQVTHLTLSCDGLTLAVCVMESDHSHLNVYDVRRFAEPISQPVTPFLDINLGGGEQVTLLDMAWNPGQASTLVTCVSSGRLDLYNITDKLEIKAYLATAKAKCVAWSPKGKQMVVGTEDGLLIQYDFDLKEKRRWDCPPIFDNQPYYVVSIVWLSTYTFLVGYISKDSDDSEQPVLILINGSKEGPITYGNFEDICFGTGEGQKRKYFLNWIQPWDIVITGSASASEIAVMGKHLDTKQTWERWNLDDAARAECPLTEDFRDTFPLGMSVDCSSEMAISLGDERTHPPSPLMLILTTAGYIIPYHCMYFHKEAQPITVKAEALTSAGCRHAVGGGQGPGASAPQAFGGTPSAVKNLFGTNSNTTSPLFGTSSQASVKPVFGSGLSGQTTTNSLFPGTGLGPAPKENQSLFLPKFSTASSQSETKPGLFSGSAPSSFSFTAPKASGFAGISAPQSSAPSSIANPVSTKSTGFGSLSLTASSSQQPFGLGSSSQKTIFSTPVTTQAPAMGGFGIALGQASNSSFALSTTATKTTASVVADAGVVSFTTTSMAPAGSFNFSTKASGQTTGFGLSAPAPTVIGSKPAPASTQATPAQPANPTMFTKPSTGSQPSSALSGVPQSTSGSITLSGMSGFGQPANIGKEKGFLPTPTNQSSASGLLHKSSTLASLTQVDEPASTTPAPKSPTQAPPPPYPGSLSSKVGMEREAASQREVESREADTVDRSFAQSIQEEIQDFEKELLDLKSRAGKTECEIGTRDEMIRLRKMTQEMGTFNEEIKKTVQEQDKDVQEQTTLCLDMFTMVEECRVRQQLNCDPKYKSLLKSRALDSASAAKLQQLQLQNQGLEQGLRDVDLILHTQWEDYQNRKKNQSRRVQAPTSDAVYRVVKSNHNLILAQKSRLKEMEEKLKQLKLYNRTSAWNNSGLQSHYSAGDTSNVLSSLADSLVETGSISSTTKKSSDSGSVRGNKLSQLRDYLYHRHVPVVKSTKPENLSMSRLTIPDTTLTRSSRKSPEKPAGRSDQTARQRSLRLDADQTAGQGSLRPDGQPRGQAGSTHLAGHMMGATSADKKVPPQQAPKPSSKPTLIQKPVPTATGKKTGATFPGLSALVSSLQPAPSSEGQFHFDMGKNTGQGFQGFGMEPGPKGKTSTTYTMPKFGEINGIKLEDITPSGSENEVETTEEDEEYDEEEEDSSESNGTGFGLQYSLSEQGKPGSQITSTPVAVKPPKDDVPTPKAGSASTPIGRKLFGQEDGKPASTLQTGTGTSQGASFGSLGLASGKPPISSAFGSTGSSSGSMFSGPGIAAAESKSGGAGFNFSTAQGSKPGVPSDSQSSGNAESEFKFSGTTGATFSFGSSTSKPFSNTTGMTGLFGTKTGVASSGSTGTGATSKPLTFSSATAVPSSTSVSSTSTTSSVPTASSTPGLSSDTSNTGTDALSGSTIAKGPATSASTTVSQPGGPISGFSAATSGSGLFGKPSAVSRGQETSPATSSTSFVGFGFGNSNESRQPSGNATSGMSAILTSVSTAQPSSTSIGFTGSFGSSTATSSSASGLFGKGGGDIPAASSTTSSSVFGQPTDSFSKPGTTQSAVVNQSGTVTQPSSAGIGQSTASTQSSPFTFGQSGASTQSDIDGFGHLTVVSQSSPFAFSQSAGTKPSSTPLFGQSATSTSGNSATGLFGKPVTTTSTGGSLFGQTPASSSGGIFGQTPASSSGVIFGQTPSSSGGIFGQTPASSSGSLFGQTSTSGSGLFGSQSTGTGGGLFGTATSSGGSLFGQSPASSSSTGLFGTATTSSTGTFSFTQPTFGQSSGFGQPASSGSGSGFGQTGSQGGSGGLFGQTGNESGSGGLFAGLGGKPSAEKANTNVFGSGTFGSQPQTSSSGLFGSSTGATFGTSHSSGGSGAFSGGGAGVGSTGFGSFQQPSTGGGFGTSGFGGNPAFGGSPSFGSPPRFGASPGFGGGGFGSQPTFGSASPLGGGTAAGGGGTFGSASSDPSTGFAGFASAGSPTFGALAQSSDTPTFGALNSGGGGGFGSPSFGGQQQNPPAFGGGGGTFGASPQFTGYRG